MPYPDSWGPLPLPTSDDCRQFEGKYADLSEGFLWYGSPIVESLTQYLLFATYAKEREWNAATRVDLSLPSNSELLVVVWGGQEKLFTRTLNDSDFSCEHGRLVLRKSEGIAREGVLGVSRTTITFSITESYLVAEHTERTVGSYALIPIVGNETRWARFRRNPE
jgi:hypothetical protein